MTANPIPSFNRSRRTGLTLIEVIAAALLLGTLLVSIIVAYGRHASQIKKAEQRLAVLDALDAKIADWYLTRRGIPENQSGLLLSIGSEPIRWESQTISNRTTRQVLLSDKIRVEARTNDGEVIASIEVLQAATR